jgi:hypothetical protein
VIGSPDESRTFRLYGKVHSEYVSVANRVSTNEMQAVNLRDGSLHYAQAFNMCIFTCLELRQ